MSFHSNFLFFLCVFIVDFYDVWLYRSTTIDLFIGFHISNSDDKLFRSDKEIIKSMFVNMFYQN